MIVSLLALVLASPTLPKACEPPAARDVTALAELAKKSGAVSVGLDSVATWCFDSAGAWTGGHKLKKGQQPDPEAIPSGDCAKAIGSCEGAKLVLTDDLRGLLFDTLADLDTPYLGVKYTPRRSGLSERPPEVMDCRSKNRSELFSQAQARMDIARLANQAQSEYRNFRTWLYKESLTCAQMVARGETDLTRRGVAIDTPVQKGGGALVLPDAGGFAVTAGAGAGATGAGATGAGVAGAGSAGGGVAGASGVGAAATGTGVAGTGAAGAGVAGAGVAGAGTGVAGTGVTGTGVAGAGVAGAGTGTGAGVAGSGTTGASVAGGGTTGSGSTGAKGAGAAGAGTSGTGVVGAGAAGAGTSGTGVVGAGAVGAGSTGAGAAGAGTTGTGVAGAGAGTIGSGVAGAGVVGAGAAGAGTMGAGAAGTGVAGAGTTGTGVAGAGAAGAGATGAGVAGAGVAGKGVAGTGATASGGTGSGVAPAGTAAGGGTGSISGAVAASPGLGAAVASVTKDLPLGGPTVERQRALASSMLVKWRYLADQRARLEPDPDWVTGFLASRELKDCRCQRVEPKELVARMESGDRVATLQADDEKNTRCELCLQDSYAPWKARVQKQCAQMDDFTDYELGVLERSADGAGLPPRCFDASRARRAAKTAAKPPTGQGSVTQGKGGTAFIITKSPEPPAPVAQGAGAEKPSEYAPIPPREDGKVYYRVFMSRACEAEVEPGPITVRTGDLMPVPPGAAALIVKSPCGGMVEVYIGREEKPRITEVFGKTQPLRLQFRKP